MEPVNFQVGQSFGTYEELKAKLEAMATKKKEVHSNNIENEVKYYNAEGEEIGDIFVGSERKYDNGKGEHPPEGRFNNGSITIGNATYIVPTIRDGNGGKVNKIIVDYETKAYDKNKNGIIDEGELKTEDTTKNN